MEAADMPEHMGMYCAEFGTLKRYKKRIYLQPA
jgi:hypothetical protein